MSDCRYRQNSDGCVAWLVLMFLIILIGAQTSRIEKKIDRIMEKLEITAP